MFRQTGAKRLLCGLGVAVFATVGMAGTASANADTFTVNNTSDAALGGSVTCAGSGATCTLRAAIQAADAAGGSSTITLPAGTYKLTLTPPSGGSGSDSDDPATGDLDVDNNASVTLAGAGAGSTVINANSVDRAFAVHEGAGLSISDVTIESGSPASESLGSEDGGAIYTDGSLSTDDVDFTANGSDDGGAIYADTDSRLSIDGGTFTGNGWEYGGAVSDDSGNPAEVQNATFTQQTAYYYGGDVYYDGAGSLTITDSNFTDTTTYDGGGAIYAEGDGDVAISGSQFTDDSSYYAGAIYSDDSISLTQDTFTDDTATYDGYGGALYLEGTNDVLSQDQFNDDSATYYGGAIYTEEGTLDMSQSSISGSESYYGGAIFLDSSSASLENDTITKSSAVYGGALYLDTTEPLSLVNDTIAGNTASDYAGGIYDASYAEVGSGDGVVNTIIADNVGGDCDSAFSSSEVTGYDLDSDSSCFGGLTAPGLLAGVQPSLAAAANNGGSVLTMREQAGSPTIGTGDTTYCPSTDARGVTRAASSCDLGAYQAVSTGLTASNSAPASADLNGTFEVRLTGTNNGPGGASNLTVTDQLPTGTSLAGQQTSAGGCSVSGTPAKVTCDLGNVGSGASSSVDLFVSSSTIGTFSNTATVSDDQGASQSATAVTAIVSRTAKPTVSRAEVKQITTTAATLRARLNPHNNEVSYFFEYGTTRRFGKVTRVRQTSKSGIVSARIVGLASGRRYYYRLVASSGAKVSFGGTYSFKTKARKHSKRK
jgi:uncharacterized repeat protein (TIGR01451 family)